MRGRLEAQRGEEPLILSSIVAILQFLCDRGTGGSSRLRLIRGGGRGGERGDINEGLERVNVEGVPSRHEVVVINNLDEGGDLATLGDLLGIHLLCHLTRILLDSSHHAVPV